MRYDPNKAYPYPVLRHDSSDYPRAEFQVEITVERIPSSTALQIEADFDLSDPDLLRLVDSKMAHYVLLVRAAGTQHRSVHTSVRPHVSKSFPTGVIARRLEARGVLVARRAISGLTVAGWHLDYADHAFDIPPGAVLAEDEPKIWEIDNAEEAPIGAILYRQVREDLPNGQWECDLTGEIIVLYLSPDDHRRFEDARSKVATVADLAVLMNSMYLPALVHVLHVGDQDPDEYADRRWYRSLEARLLDRGRPVLGESSDRLNDAQQLLERPFHNLNLAGGNR